MAPEHISAFFNIPGLLVVIGGTIAATIVSRPIAEVKRVMKQLPALLEDERSDASRELNQLLQFADVYRRGSVRLAEEQINQIHHPLLITGLHHIADGGTKQSLLKLLRNHIHTIRHRGESEVQILRTMSVFAPAFGMLGTLFGLIHMLHGLGASGIAEIGTAMGFAMITTLYGIVAANLFLKPLAMKLERRHQQQVSIYQMLCEGMMMIQERTHPQLILESLDALGSHRIETAPQSVRPVMASAA
jgi:chemotaxis protein MotA